MNLTESNLISLNTELKQGQRCIRIGNSIIPVGVGGIFAPGSNSSAPAGADVTLGVVDSQGRFQALRFNGTQASNSGSAIQVQNYKTWNSTLPAPQPSGGSMDFYKCTYVSSDSSMTWGGRKAVLNDGVYSFQSNSTDGLIYGAVKPSVSEVYSFNALIKATLWQGLPIDGLILYVPLATQQAYAQTGQQLTEEGDITYTTQSGIPCAYFSYGSWLAIAGELQLGTGDFAISIWGKCYDYNINNFLWSANGGPNARLVILSSGQIQTTTYNDTTAGRLVYQVDKTRWHHIILQRASGVDYLIVDGVSRASTSDTSNLVFPSTYLGRWRAEGEQYIDGYISSFRVYNRALTPAEIAALAAEFTPTQA